MSSFSARMRGGRRCRFRMGSIGRQVPRAERDNAALELPRLCSRESMDENPYKAPQALPYEAPEATTGFVDWLRGLVGLPPRRRIARCSFCWTSWSPMFPLAEGPAGVYICRECVGKCGSLL